MIDVMWHLGKRSEIMNSPHAVSYVRGLPTLQSAWTFHPLQGAQPPMVSSP